MARTMTLAMTLLVGTLAHAQELDFREFPIATPGSAPIDVAEPPQGSTIFIEFEGNKVGVLLPNGVGEEATIPTPNSGPMSLVYFAANSSGCPQGFEFWFTESRANRIGRVCYLPQGDNNPSISSFSFLPEIPIPTPASEPRGIVITAGSAFPEEGLAYFTEFEGNKIARLAANGTVTEFPVPTVGSGPWGIARASRQIWFTEYLANKIGRLDPATGAITEFPIPTPNSGPVEIVASGDDLWFTESNAGKIGRITQEGVITEYPLPDPTSQPFGIARDPSGGIWFTERAAARVGRARPDGAIREFVLPTPGSGPAGISAEVRSFGGAHRIVVAESTANKLAIAEADYLVVVGAGNTGPTGPGVPGPGPWDTEFEVSNPETFGVSLVVTPNGPFPGPCFGAFCGQTTLRTPALGTSTLFASAVLRGRSAIETWYASPTGFDLPTVKARIINREIPSLSADLPVVRHSTIAALDPQMLSFPGAEKNAAGARSNLILKNLERRAFVDPGPMTVAVEVFSPAGALLGTGTFTLDDSTLLLIDVVGQLGVTELDDGQIRVRKIAGDGLLWGILATIREDATLTISLGVNP